MAAQCALKAVLVDLSSTLRVEDSAVPGMQEALKRLILDGAPLIAIHKARYFKKKDGLALGRGPFVTRLEYVTDTKAAVVGKPEKTFFMEALRVTDFAPEETVMISDDCRDDVGGTQNIGMHGILVRTGKYRPADEDKINPAPYLTRENFPEAVEHILEHLL